MKKLVSVSDSKMKILAILLLMAFFIPQVTFAALTCNCTPSVWYNPISWLPMCDDCPTGAVNIEAPIQQGGDTTTGSNKSLTYSGSGVRGVFDLFQAFLSRALILLISLAIVWFVWNVFRYVIATDEVDKAVAKDKMVWGIIAIFIMVSIWGLVAILQYTFQIFPSSSAPQIKNIFPTFGS